MKDKLGDGTLEEAIELAYWIYERRRATQKNSESERDAFKCVVRKLINERPLVETHAAVNCIPLTSIPGAYLVPVSIGATGTAVCLHMSVTLDPTTGKTVCNHCKEDITR